jgi:hypothetical protein
MQTLQACVKMSIISVKTEYLQATGLDRKRGNSGRNLQLTLINYKYIRNEKL